MNIDDIPWTEWEEEEFERLTKEKEKDEGDETQIPDYNFFTLWEDD